MIDCSKQTVQRHGNCVDRSVFLSFWAQRVLRTWLTSASHGRRPRRMRLDDRCRGHRQDSYRVCSCIGHRRNLVLNVLSDWQPVQRVTKYRSDVLVESGASDEARSGVHYRLQTPGSVRRSAIQDRVAIIHLAVNQRVDESVQHVEGK